MTAPKRSERCGVCREPRIYIAHTPIPDTGCNLDLCDCKNYGSGRPGFHHPFQPARPDAPEKCEHETTYYEWVCPKCHARVPGDPGLGVLG